MFSYSYDNLNRITKTQRGAEFVQEVKSEYDRRYEGKPILALEYSQFKRFYIDGDRSSFQSQYFDRRRRLAYLQVLSIADDSYIDALEDIMSAICDEFIWSLPAHAFDKGVVAKYEYIDLFAAETAMYLAETSYIFGDKLSKDIRNKIYLAIKYKVTDVFERTAMYFEETHSNWAAVCACGVGLAYLYLFPERFDLVKERIFNCMEHYLLGIGEEGYCEEGMNYWQYGFGFFAFFFDVYTQLTGDYPDILRRPTVLNELKYPTNAHLGKGIYLPYSDGGSLGYIPTDETVYAIKNLFGDDFPMIQARTAVDCARALLLRTLYGRDRFGECKASEPTVGTVYYKEREVFIRKQRNFAFTAKCGSNYELHNHNDVGAFAIAKDGKCPIADLGAGEYTKEYFLNPEVRFGEKVFVCGSMGHSVPVVDGRYQKHWKPYKGKVLFQSETEFEMDIAGAYEENAEGMLVKYTVQENGVLVTYRNTQNKPVCYRFVSPYEPKTVDGGVRVDELTILSKNGVAPVISAKEYTNTKRQRVTVYAIDYFVEPTDKKIVFEFSF